MVRQRTGGKTVYGYREPVFRIYEVVLTEVTGVTVKSLGLPHSFDL
jgi:hypothetical protein